MSTDEDDDQPVTIECVHHGSCVAAVLCVHLLRKDGESVGFVENSAVPHDLQAWCRACENKYAEEGEMTEAFRAFHQMVVVCTHCYEDARLRHNVPAH